MLSVIERLFSISWTYCLTRICCLWRLRLNCTFRRVPSPHNLRPLTDRQRKLKTDEFIDSIDTDARLRRNREEAPDVETQIAELEQKAARQWDIVGKLWSKIHEMREEEKNF